RSSSWRCCRSSRSSALPCGRRWWRGRGGVLGVSSRAAPARATAPGAGARRRARQRRGRRRARGRGIGAAGVVAARAARRAPFRRDGPGPRPGAVCRRAGPRRHLLVDRPLRGAAMRERGQATVELVGMLPLLFLIALAACQVLLAGLAREAAHQAAQAGAMALLQGGDPAGAARASVPDWSRRRLSVAVSGRTV